MPAVAPLHHEARDDSVDCACAYIASSNTIELVRRHVAWCHRDEFKTVAWQVAAADRYGVGTDTVLLVFGELGCMVHKHVKPCWLCFPRALNVTSTSSPTAVTAASNGERRLRRTEFCAVYIDLQDQVVHVLNILVASMCST